jgi:hypothetical protein
MLSLSESPSRARLECGGVAEWLQPFLHNHFLQMGAMAWQGLQLSGRGMVCCDVEFPHDRPIRWDIEDLPHRISYVPLHKLASCLDQRQMDTELQLQLQRTLVTYDVATELIALMLAAEEPTIVQLRQMRIPPAECFHQLQRRRAEFCGVAP